VKLKLIILSFILGPRLLFSLEADFIADSLHGSLGDIISFGWTISHDPGTVLDFGEINMDATGIELLDQQVVKGDVESQLQISAAVYDSVGIYHFPSLVVYGTGAEGLDSLYLQGPDLTILSILTVSDTSFRDIKDLHRIKTPFNLMILLWLAVLGVVSYLIYYLVRRVRMPHKQIIEPRIIVPPEQAHIIALRAFEQLKRSKYLRFEQFKKFHTELSHILREYYENRYLIDALELTTSELMQILEGMIECEQEHVLTTRNILELADFIKFAKGTSTELESGEALNKAIKIVNQTKIRNEQGDTT